MRIKLVSRILAILFIGVGISQAGLDITSPVNASFESVENGGTPGGWGYVIDDWFESETPNSAANFYEKGSGIGLVGDGELWVGTETGGLYYQQVGTVDDGATYTVSALIGARDGTSFKTGTFRLYASSLNAATNAADGVTLSSFATLLSTNDVTVADGTPTGDADVYSVAVDLTTGTGHAGEVLWLEFGSVTGKDYFDKINILVANAPAAPPEWVDPLVASEAAVNTMYEDTLVGKAKDPNGDAITFSKTAGPSWLTVASDGTLSGSPLSGDVGNNTFTVLATDVDGSTSATLTISVRGALPPEWVEPVTSSDGIVGVPYTDSLAGKATDPDGTEVTFARKSGPAWLAVGFDGALSGTPTAGDLGTNTFVVTATDLGGAKTDADLTIVVQASQSPVWTIDPVDGGIVFAGKNYNGTLAGRASDPDGQELTFSKVDGPLWLTVNADGSMSGTAPVAVGTNTFTVSANDGLDPVTPATLLIVVSDPADVPKTISLNFAQNANNQAFAGGEPIGPLSTDSANWNSTLDRTSGTLAAGTMEGLIDSSGDATTANVTWSSKNMWWNAGGVGDDQAKLAVGYLDDGSGISVTVSNIPYASYRVYGLISSDGGNVAEGFDSSNPQVNGTWVYAGDINSSRKCYGTVSITQSETGSSWIESTETSLGNYWVVETSGTLTITIAKESPGRASLSGIVIEEVSTVTPPEPVTDLTIQGPVSAGTEMILMWTAVDGKTYGVETNGNLIVGDWQPLTTGLEVSGGGSLIYTNAVGPGDLFYRVISE